MKRRTVVVPIRRGKHEAGRYPSQRLREKSEGTQQTSQEVSGEQQQIRSCFGPLPRAWRLFCTFVCSTYDIYVSYLLQVHRRPLTASSGRIPSTSCFLRGLLQPSKTEFCYIDQFWRSAPRLGSLNHHIVEWWHDVTRRTPDTTKVHTTR